MSNCFSILTSEVLLMDCDLIIPGKYKCRTKRVILAQIVEILKLQVNNRERHADGDRIKLHYSFCQHTVEKLRHVSSHCQDFG